MGTLVSHICLTPSSRPTTRHSFLRRLPAYAARSGKFETFLEIFQHCFVKIGANLLGNTVSPKNKNVMLERRFQTVVSSKMATKSFELPCLFS